MKVPSWFKWEPTGYWTLQLATIAAATWFTYSALYGAETRHQIVFDAFLGGANFFNGFHNWLHRRRNRFVRELHEIMEEQNRLLRALHAVKGEEIAKMIAAQVNADLVSIQGPQGPIDPNPTKH